MNNNTSPQLPRLVTYVLLGFAIAWGWQWWQGQHRATQHVAQAPALSSQDAHMLYAHADVDPKRLVQVHTDVLRLAIDRKGGAIVQAALLKYPEKLHGTQPVELLSDRRDALRVAQAGLAGDAQCTFTSRKASWTMRKGQPLRVGMTCHHDGLAWQKVFTFRPGHYDVGVTTTVTNQSGKPWTGHFYVQLKEAHPKAAKRSLMQFNTYTGPAYATPEKAYVKWPYKKLRDADLSVRGVENGWLAIQKRYFLNAWVPPRHTTYQVFGQRLSNDAVVLGLYGGMHRLNHHESLSVTSHLYVGPELKEPLAALAPGLELTIDYGMLWMVSDGIMWLMSHIHHVVGNWGWSIVLVTLFIKLLFYRFSASSYRSMARMKALQPKLEALQARHQGDKQALGQATMALYREEKVNPLGGCLPVIVQIPVFIALYWVLMECVQLRHAPFVLWIHDLSARDPYYVLPVLLGISMFVQQRLTPSQSPEQAKMMMALPVVFTALFLNFPAGLVVYWLTNNVLSIAQQWWMMKRFA